MTRSPAIVIAMRSKTNGNGGLDRMLCDDAENHGACVNTVGGPNCRRRSSGSKRNCAPGGASWSEQSEYYIDHPFHLITTRFPRFSRFLISFCR